MEVMRVGVYNAYGCAGLAVMLANAGGCRGGERGRGVHTWPSMTDFENLVWSSAYRS